LRDVRQVIRGNFAMSVACPVRANSRRLVRIRRYVLVVAEFGLTALAPNALLRASTRRSWRRKLVGRGELVVREGCRLRGEDLERPFVVYRGRRD
jgi:hypothetical protein